MLMLKSKPGVLWVMAGPCRKDDLSAYVSPITNSSGFVCLVFNKSIPITYFSLSAII